MNKITLIGTGKLAHNAAAALAGTPWKIVQVIGTEAQKAKSFAEKFGIESWSDNPTQVNKNSDFIWIAVPDSAIRQVAEQLSPHAGPNAVAAHSSGSAPLSALDAFGDRAGILYLLQTFTLGHPADFSKIPVFLEVRPQSEEVLRSIAKLWNGEVRDLDSEGRKRLHLGAVFACNFPNLMWILAEKILSRQELPLGVYENLVRENVSNVFSQGATESLTGPAKRGDSKTIEAHLEMLSNDPGLQEVYRLLTEQIQKL